MEIKYISSLVEIASSNNLTKLEITEGETKIVIEKNVSSGITMPILHDVAVVDKPVASVSKGSHDELDFSHLTAVKSPIVGVFYSSPSPESPAFVSIGNKVKKGDVLCIIEAMKLMNEITAEQDGEIVDICIKNGDIAEFGQVLFKMA
jgi:acetyl-CoA carboxylase biotin carboxyl carrier protein